MALSKNHGSKVRYLKRLQQEEEANREQKEAMRRCAEWDDSHGFGNTEREDI